MNVRLKMGTNFIRFTAGALSVLLILSNSGCDRTKGMTTISGTASLTTEATIHVPDLMDEFLSTFSGVYRADGKSLIQIGWKRATDRDYVAESIIEEIPGCEPFDEDGDLWWPSRGEEPNLKKLLLYTSSINQELIGEQMFGP